MIPINKKFNLTERDVVSITHLGTKSPVTVWATEALFTMGSNCILQIVGRTHQDGYLPIVVKVNGRLAYPKKGMNACMPNTSVSLEFHNVLLSNVKEDFACDERTIDRVLYRRYRKSYELSINPARKRFYADRMAEIKAKHKGGP